jgi:2'-phosphotransferase
VFILYETSYEAFPRILAAGGIQQKATGATYVSFTQVSLEAEGGEPRPTRTSDADVTIWIALREVMEANPDIEWHRTAAGGIATTNDIPTHLWKKAVARRPEIGILFEDGQVRNEVPESLRGRGAKGKAKSSKANLRVRDEDTTSDSAGDV